MQLRPAARMARARGRGWGALLGALLLLGSLPALAQDRVPVRVGDHPTHGRLVFDWPAPPAFTVEQQGDRLVLRFPAGAAVDLAGARRPPRNMLAVTPAEGGIAIALKPGARARVFRIGNRLVVDALNPEGAAPPAVEEVRAAPSPAPASPAQARAAATAPRAAPASRPAAPPAA
ncbi:hypothetical protein JYK14_28395, partial [Siccirubricoccus sp. KC 17139]|nr:hypothetical protein [Siccirubricoccus soli]MCP2686182.1 hypothetical protein [Siccirubricoccus soli]